MIAKLLPVFAALAVFSNSQNTGNAVIDALSTVDNLRTLKSVLASEPFIELTKGAPFNGEFTVFAPSDDAFDRAGDLGKDNDLIKAILTYHVLPTKVLSSTITEKPIYASSVMDNAKYVNLPLKSAQMVGAVKECDGVKVLDGTYIEGQSYPKVIKADISVGKGVVHIIDKVLTLPQPISTVLKSNVRYSTLLSLLNQTKSVDALDGLSGATLFAPSNSAFLPIINAKQQPSADDLKYVLYGHVINGISLPTTRISTSPNYQTLNKNKNLNIEAKRGELKAGDSIVVQPNIIVKNGVIHRINKVITVAK
ncbi:hypothetical protein BB561_000853 [Smittium simulii]|uniref:FAS1 domain-containing protein n=1 Tax=Smittium simulii TaxID=133385 RepID=A0A2T9YX92_9FUNG|nr:hypothetical protein BB561_000853 [Smittium simulii]